MTHAKNLEIRLAAVTDVATIAAVARRTWNNTYQGIILPETQETLLNRWYAHDSLRAALNMEDSWFYVALSNSELVGFAQFHLLDNERCQLSRVYVLPEWQGQSVGSRLMETGLHQLALRGVNRTIVHVESENVKGKAFYEGKGFRHVRTFATDLPKQILNQDEYVLKTKEPNSAARVA
jgi:ribosomal protein S18 acetylase RimI-like enzyme